ncbi:MAG: hypothetical protein KDC95_05130 [Planctomycetes bacterium]|nr:hypothetical protein [Planctomycetota bacterium]
MKNACLMTLAGSLAVLASLTVFLLAGIATESEPFSSSDIMAVMLTVIAGIYVAMWVMKYRAKCGYGRVSWITLVGVVAIGVTCGLAWFSTGAGIFPARCPIFTSAALLCFVCTTVVSGVGIFLAMAISDIRSSI